MFVGDWLDFRNRFTPRRCAVYDRDKKIKYTYAMLFKNASLLSNFLFRTVKVNKGDRVALLSENRIECLEIFFASAKVGGIFVNIHTGLLDADLAEVVSHARPVILFYSNHFEKSANLLRDLKIIKHFVKLQDKGALYYEVTPSFSYPVEEVEMYLEDPVAIQYNYGESGELLGAIISHGMITWNAINTTVAFKLNEHDCAPLFSPFWSTPGLFMFTLPLIYAGGTTVITSDYKMEKILELLSEEDITFVYMEPPLFEKMSDLFHDFNAEKLRFCISAGLCPVECVIKMQKNRVFSTRGYLLDRAGPNNFLLPEADSCKRPDSIGCPLIHVEAAISDEEGRLLPEGEVGELLIRGHHVFSGYWNNPKATFTSFLKGWLRTREKARCEDGYYYVVD